MASTRDRLERLERGYKELVKRIGGPVLTDDQLGADRRSVPWWAKILVGILASIILAYAGWLGVTADNDNARLSRVEQRLNDLANTVDQVQKSLDSVQLSISFRKLADMEPKEFATALPTLHRLVRQAPAKLKPDPTTLHLIAGKLRQTPETSQDYWPTVLRFIQFASASAVAPSGVPPPDSVYQIVSNIQCSNAGHCIVASGRAIELDGGSIPNSIFSHCRIRFTNNPVNLAGTKFIDCVFEMPRVANPSTYLKTTTKVLLASNLRVVTFPKS